MISRAAESDALSARIIVSGLASRIEVPSPTVVLVFSCGRDGLWVFFQVFGPAQANAQRVFHVGGQFGEEAILLPRLKGFFNRLHSIAADAQKDILTHVTVSLAVSS